MLILFSLLLYYVGVFLLSFILQYFLILIESVGVTGIISLILHLDHVFFGLINKTIWGIVVSVAIFQSWQDLEPERLFSTRHDLGNQDQQRYNPSSAR